VPETALCSRSIHLETLIPASWNLCLTKPGTKVRSPGSDEASAGNNGAMIPVPPQTVRYRRRTHRGQGMMTRTVNITTHTTARKCQ
jgi:hypothetical protein